MAQEFASDNSKNGLFSRLKLSNHRGFFSFIFATLSVIFILITFAAVQQQQTTQSKADTNLCSKVNCSAIKISGSGSVTTILKNVEQCNSIPCCEAVSQRANIGFIDDVSKICQNKSNGSFYCSNLATSALCTGVGWNPYCEWDSSKSKCDDKGSASSCSCTDVGQGCSISGSTTLCEGYTCSPTSTGSTNGTCKKQDLSTCFKINDTFNSETTSKTCCSTLTPIAKNPSTPKIFTCVSCVTGTGGCYKDGCGSFDAITGGKTCCSGYYPKSASTTNSRLVSCVAGTPASTIISTDVACNGIEGYCLKDTSGKALPSSGICSYPGKPNGEYKSGYCPGGVETRCCSTSTTTKPPAGEPPVVVDPPVVVNPPTNTPTPVPGGNGNVTLDLKLAFQGIVTLPKTKTQLKIRVKIVDAENREKQKDNSIFTADSNGIWSGKVTFEDVDLSQKYYVLIKGPIHVQKKICKVDAADPNPGYYSCQFGNINLVSGTNNFDFSKVKMLVGDLDQNAVVNSIDTSTVLNALLLSADERQSSAVLDKADLNLDGIVSTQDWSLVLEALKIKYDER